MIRKMILNPYLRPLALLIVTIFVLALILPASAGCGGGTSASNTFIELLNLVPASAVGNGMPFSFTLIDYASAYEADGITLTTPEELINNFTDMDKDNISYSFAGSGSFITGYSRYAFPPSIKKEHMGYDVTCVDAEIQFGMPPGTGVAAIGRFDPQATKDALSHQDDWPDSIKARYTTEEYHGVTIHSWGDGFQMDLTNRLAPLT